MDISNRFSIITYVGSSPLNLMAKDAAISSDPVKNDQWDKLIQAVDTIYASQVVGGAQSDSIPVFFTSQASVADRLGNTSFRYFPSPDSTLKQLDSKSSYYIILRDVSSVPLKIPSNGSVILGYSDIESPPLVSPSLSDVTLTNSFKYDFKPQIINLKSFETYSYAWEVVSSNWPVATNALSGTLRPASATGTINSTIAFCPTTGSCSNLMLPYNLPDACSLENIEQPYVTLKLSVKTSSGAESLSDQFTITCNDCLPKPRISIQNVSTSEIIESDADDAPIPYYDFRLNFNNLEVNQSYDYSIETIKAEWPIIFLSPVSGSFIVKSNIPNPIEGRLFFCPTTGLCPPNGIDIPNYTIPSYPKFLADNINYKIILRASLTANNECSNNNTVYSDLTTLTYKKS